EEGRALPALGGEARAQLQGRHHSRGLGPSQPVCALELWQRAARKPPQPGDEELLREVEGGGPARSRPEQQRAELAGGESGGAVTEEPSPRPLLRGQRTERAGLARCPAAFADLSVAHGNRRAS